MQTSIAEVQLNGITVAGHQQVDQPGGQATMLEFTYGVFAGERAAVSDVEEFAIGGVRRDLHRILGTAVLAHEHRNQAGNLNIAELRSEERRVGREWSSEMARDERDASRE